MSFVMYFIGQIGLFNLSLNHCSQKKIFYLSLYEQIRMRLFHLFFNWMITLMRVFYLSLNNHSQMRAFHLSLNDHTDEIIVFVFESSLKNESISFVVESFWSKYSFVISSHSVLISAFHVSLNGAWDLPLIVFQIVKNGQEWYLCSMAFSCLFGFVFYYLWVACISL